MEKIFEANFGDDSKRSVQHNANDWVPTNHLFQERENSMEKPQKSKLSYRREDVNCTAAENINLA